MKFECAQGPARRLGYFVGTQTCAGASEALIFSEPIGTTTGRASFTLLLKTPYFYEVHESAIWKIFGILGIGFILCLVAWGIRQQEKYLMSRINLLSRSLRKVESFFISEPSSSPARKIEPAGDELDVISKTIEQAAEVLEQKTRQIEDYKKRFESKTRMQQLAQTISYTSHNLKAPLQEGVEFLRDLPDFIETMPRASIIRAAKSLEDRLKSAAENLQQALNATKASELTPVNLSLHEALTLLKSRVEVNPTWRRVKIKLDTAEGPDNVYCVPNELDSVLWNLTKNSIEAKADSHISLATTIQGSEIIFDFKDDGPGIPDGLLDQIFSDFYTTKASGTGLGLASAKRAIEKSRGRMSALPAEQGVHFRICLPLVKEAPHVQT